MHNVGVRTVCNKALRITINKQGNKIIIIIIINLLLIINSAKSRITSIIVIKNPITDHREAKVLIGLATKKIARTRKKLKCF